MYKELMEMGIDRRAILFLGTMILALGGCSSGESYEHANVHGKVTYQGKPVTFGSVLFMPVETPKEGTMQPASGSIQPDGTYELASQSSPGAILGEHKVLVIAVDGGQPIEAKATTKTSDNSPLPAGGAKNVQFKSAIPKKYSNPSTTTLTRKVERGDNKFDIELID